MWQGNGSGKLPLLFLKLDIKHQTMGLQELLCGIIWHFSQGKESQN